MRYRILALIIVMFTVKASLGAAQPYKLFIATCANCDSNTHSYFRETLDHKLRHRLPFADEIGKATYSLQNVNLTNEVRVMLTADFYYDAGRHHMAIVAHSKPYADLNSRVASALDDLLIESLFKSGVGPYAELTVTACQIFPPDQIVLDIDWRGGIGIDSKLYYELAIRQDGFTSPRGTNVYVFFDGADPAKGRLTATVSSGRPTKCPGALIRHSIPPPSSEGSQYGNFSRPQPAQR